MYGSARTLKFLVVAATVLLVVPLWPIANADAACHGGSPNGIRENGEMCDGADTGPYLCQHFCWTGGPVGCTSDCMIDPTPCEGCGNGRRDPSEACEGSDLGGATCNGPSETGGTPACTASCQVDHGPCWRCGNNRIDPNEQCEIGQLNGATCNGPGETGGTPTCTACHVDHSSCWRCGNGRVDPGEQCDDSNTTAGDGCGPTCQLECGNGTVEQNEECDDGNNVSGDGCYLCGLEAIYDGGGGQTRECNMHWGVSGPPAPSGLITCTDGNTQCDKGTLANECTFRVFYCFNRSAFSGGPTCTPSNIARVELTGASLSGPTALNTAGQDAILNAMSATLTRAGSTVTRTGARLDAVPAMSALRQCGLFMLTVPKGQDRAASLRATDSVASTDDDLITFRCQ